MVMTMFAATSISACASTLEVLFALDGLGGFLPAFVIRSVHEVRHFFALRKFFVKIEELKSNLVPAFLQLSLYNNEIIFFGFFFLVLYFLILGQALHFCLLLLFQQKFVRALKHPFPQAYALALASWLPT